MDDSPETPLLRSILANLGREIRRPLSTLTDGLDRLLIEGVSPLPEAELVQARTMLSICDDLDRLTRERLVDPSRRGD